jgi:hypothetical protein
MLIFDVLDYKKSIFIPKINFSKSFFEINLHYSKFFCTFAANFKSHALWIIQK